MNALIIIEIIIAIVLTALILIQNKDGGLNAAMGGGDSSFQSVKRGPEKIIFNATVTLATAFIVIGILLAIL